MSLSPETCNAPKDSTFFWRTQADPLIHHGRHFGRSIFAFANLHALLLAGISSQGDVPPETQQYVLLRYSNDYLDARVFAESVGSFEYFRNYSSLYRVWRSACCQMTPMKALFCRSQPWSVHLLLLQHFSEVFAVTSCKKGRQVRVRTTRRALNPLSSTGLHHHLRSRCDLLLHATPRLTAVSTTNERAFFSVRRTWTGQTLSNIFLDSYIPRI